MPFWTKVAVCCLYVHGDCRCGVHLDADKVRVLPGTFGPDLLSRVLRDAVQALVDAARQPKQMFAILRTRHGDGDVVVRGSFFSLFFFLFGTVLFFTDLDSNEELLRSTRIRFCFFSSFFNVRVINTSVSCPYCDAGY